MITLPDHISFAFPWVAIFNRIEFLALIAQTNRTQTNKMIKVCLLVALAVACVSAQEAPASEAAPEPYSYAYQTESHAAAEQRDPSGKVTGYYTLVDADGRERRVEYIADEAGFRAKVATNEVGTKSENPADVEINASEPTPNQYVAYQQAPVPQVQYQARQQFLQQSSVVPPRVTTTSVQQPARSQFSFVQQQQQQPPQTSGYGYGYGSNPYYSSGYYNPGYGYANSYGYGYGRYLNAGNYNNHLPSQYYRSISSAGSVVPSSYTVGGANSVRYVSQPGVTTTGVRTVNYPVGGVSYSNAPTGITTSTRTVSSSSNAGGSSNYLVLQKRDTAEKKSN